MRSPSPGLAKKKTSALLAFAKDPTWKGIDGGTNLWREMNVTGAEIYADGPPHRE